MHFNTWKQNLIKEIETAAEWRAELALADPDDPRIESSQRALFDLAASVSGLPDDHDKLCALWREETELAEIKDAGPDEPETRYRDAKEELLRAIGFEHEPFDGPEPFFDVLRARVDEIISEFRLSPHVC